eukprot:CAMPEP_0194066330 /NCGR_PEP_ID=MMETSP0009_2-20130614/85958_1 /TAXON_ID=210454 /ORGANISM="Grammatophora oceanica, Strain CCMP 410" /LENGTH=925 /DNA_ID=CAMNT_0038719265 /DNA_START=36 /DNA_END=2814 /DNA_ORIENTATION=+
MAIYFHHAVRAALAALTCLSWCYAEQVSFHGEPDFDDLAPSFKGNADHNSRRLQDDCVDLEDLFFYDTFIELRTFGSSSHCTEEELAGIGVDLTEAHQSVLEVDPRLQDVVELLVNMCHTPMAEAARKLSFSYSGSGNWFNWGGSGACRWCPSSNSDDGDHGRRGLRLPLDGLLDMPLYQDEEQDHRQLQNGIVDILLWDTSNETSPHAIKPLVDGDTFDIQVYGDQFSVEAEIVGDVQQVVFDLDDGAIQAEESFAPYFFGGDGYRVGSFNVSTVELLGRVGTHTVTVTPVAPSGEQLAPVSVTYHVVDSSSTNASAPGLHDLLWNTVAVEANLDANSQTSSPTTSPTRVPTYSPVANSSTHPSVATVDSSTHPSVATVDSSTDPSVAAADDLQSLITGFKLWNTEVETNPQAIKIATVDSSTHPSVATVDSSTDPSVAAADDLQSLITGFKLWNTEVETNPQAIKILREIDEIDIDVYGDKLCIEAIFSGEEVGSVQFEFDGIWLIPKVEPPYFLGDSTFDYGQVRTYVPVGRAGRHTVKATPSTTAGVQMTPLSITYRVVDRTPKAGDTSYNNSSGVGEVVGFKLWDTSDESLPQFVKSLEEGDLIDIDHYGGQLTIEAEVYGDVERVDFGLDNKHNYHQKYSAPFTLAGNSGYSLFITCWPLATVGVHTVTATPLSSDGNILTRKTISFTTIGETTEAEEEEEQVQAGVTGFLLWDTSDEDNPKYLRTIKNLDVIDVNYYGDSLTIEAEYVGKLSKVVFGLDDQNGFWEEAWAPYVLYGNIGYQYRTTRSLSDIGTHTVTAKPYALDGRELPSVSSSFLMVDGSTNVGEMTPPESRQQLINLLEDDLSFYLSGIINRKYFYQSGHCLQWSLAYIKVELTEVEQQDATCDTRRQLLHEPDHDERESDSTATSTTRLRQIKSD